MRILNKVLLIMAITYTLHNPRILPIQYLQYSPKLLRVPAVPAVSNPEILGIQAVFTYIL